MRGLSSDPRLGPEHKKNARYVADRFFDATFTNQYVELNSTEFSTHCGARHNRIHTTANAPLPEHFPKLLRLPDTGGVDVCVVGSAQDQSSDWLSGTRTRAEICVDA